MDRTTTALVVGAVIIFAVTLVIAVMLGFRLFRTWRMLSSGPVPVSGKVAFYGALIYLVSPVDLLPDPILIDDIGVLLGAITYVGGLVGKNASAKRQPTPSVEH
ncbi:YkvA family protein [Nocardiopsis ansamitocini]|uniref:DUF1232 domain-containing protein n=1 Tax=Nocardiopsis ansamitocini TaxID=1670832 RepID=A0A9W6P842_9ACTN|nr:YkvA family protein [Nocardiopsis ansamitocini]GLU48792.1 hypothetical protein Nans01_31430 [Nocardiopsis ansamitocini]